MVTKECVSCGAPADPKSPRDFCEDCDAHFEAGQQNQERVYARAWLLEEARFNGNNPRQVELMGEIFAESLVEPERPSMPVSSATAKKVSE